MTRGGRAKPASGKAALILEKATELIRRTGNFDLPMRQLASESQVSLRAPYEIFGSKAALIRAILLGEMGEFRRMARTLPVSDPLMTIFDRIDLSVRFYGREEAFYRGLFRGADLYADNDAADPLPEIRQTFAILIERARDAGLLDAAASPALLAELVTHVFIWYFRAWAFGTDDIAAAAPRIKFGVASALIAAATAPEADRLRAIILDQQRLIEARQIQ